MGFLRRALQELLSGLAVDWLHSTKEGIDAGSM
jgi:hypothetical protein